MKNDIKIIEKWIDENFNYDRPIGILNLNEALNNKSFKIFGNINGIYIIRNLINNKKYIGSTSEMSNRINRHLYDLFNKIHHSIKLQNSINEYKFDNFEIRIYSILNIPDREFLFDIEEFLIKTYNTVKEGFNMILDSREYLYGENKPNSILNNEAVLFIRNNINKYYIEEFAEMFGVTKNVISGVIHLRSWNYLECIPNNYNPPKSVRSKEQLSKEDILFIRENASEYSNKEFQEMFSISKTTVSNIIRLKVRKEPEYIPENYSIPERHIQKKKILSKEDVLFIRNNCRNYTREELSQMFGLSVSNISAIVHLKSWTNQEYIPDNYIIPSKIGKNDSSKEKR